MTKEALKEFILSQGASRNMNFQEWDKIWTINKKYIDPVVPRFTAVEAEGAVPVTLSNGPKDVEYTTVPRHAPLVCCPLPDALCDWRKRELGGHAAGTRRMRTWASRARPGSRAS